MASLLFFIKAEGFLLTQIYDVVNSFITLSLKINYLEMQFVG